MTRLVGDLLILGRADQRQAVFKREHVDLSEIVLDAAESLSTLAEVSSVSSDQTPGG